MMMMRLLVAVILCSIAMTDANAQLFKRRYQKYEFKPRFFLVQLPTNQQKAKVYTRNNNIKMAVKARKDAAEVSKKMIMDFSDNFDFAPVYFYYDSNATEIANRKFENIVFDKDLKPAEALLRNANDTQYYITYFGYDIATTDDYNPDDNDNKDPHNGAYTTLGSNTLRLIVVDYKFKRLLSPLPRRSGVTISKKTKRDAKDYYYNTTQSSTFYRPLARNLDGLMKNFFNAGE